MFVTFQVIYSIKILYKQGFFNKTETTSFGATIQLCTQCHEACQECLDYIETEISTAYDGYNQCYGKRCSNGYFQLDLG